MRCKHSSTAFDGGRETGSDLAGTHMGDQGVDRRLPFRIVYFLRDAFVGNDARIVLRQRHEDQDTAAVGGPSDATDDELLKRGAMRPRPLRCARNQQEPHRHPGEDQGGDQEHQEREKSAARSIA